MILQLAYEKTLASIKDENYRIYLTDSLKNFTDILCAFSGNKSGTKRYYDLMNNINEEEKTKSADEIVDSVVKNAGITIK